MKRVKCQSGLSGWQGRLKEQYTSFLEFESFSDCFGLAVRLGYKSAKSAWRYNPIIQGSTNPSDFRRVRK